MIKIREKKKVNIAVRYIVKEFEVSVVGEHYEKAIGIGVKDDSDMAFPSPISNFIKSEYRNKGKSLNSQRNAAYAVTRFLNYLYENNNLYSDLRQQGLKALTLEHGAEYITHLSLLARAGELNSDYVKSEILYINHFYFWLFKQNVTQEQYLIKDKEIVFSGHKKAAKRAVRANVFEINDVEVIYPTNNTIRTGKIKTFGENRDKLIAMFINVARREAPEIALGIGLQILAGLRRSEVVNLKPSSFKWENKSLVIEVRDNQKELFLDVSNTADVQVKNPRDQICLSYDVIKLLYDEHMIQLSAIKSKKTEAMFISKTTKKTITGKSTASSFEKVKEAFLNEVLLSGNQQEYILLTSNAWSTHIGRGIFTNILLDLGLKGNQLALARGDRNINSALSYVDEYTMLNTVNMAIENFRILL